MDEYKPTTLDQQIKESVKKPFNIMQGIPFSPTEKIKDMPMDENDVIVSGYPKSGEYRLHPRTLGKLGGREGVGERKRDSEEYSIIKY